MRFELKQLLKPLILSTSIAFSIAGGLQLGAVAPLWAAGNSNAMLVIDHSLSMWGQIDGKPRYQMVKRAVAQTLKPHDGKLTLGLMSFGDRAPNSCAGGTIFQKPQLLKARNFNARLARLKPNGRTPLAGVLTSAAAALPQSGASHIVLVADGFDNCKTDPCAVARQLSETRKDLRIHVITFGASALDRSKLSCLAAQTNGRRFNATNAAALANALKGAFEVAALSDRPQASTPVARAPATTDADKPSGTAAALQSSAADAQSISIPQPRLGPRRLAAIRLAVRNAVPLPRDPPHRRSIVDEPILTGSIPAKPPTPEPSKTPEKETVAAVNPTAIATTPVMPAKPKRKSGQIIRPTFFVKPADGKGKQGIAVKAQITEALEPIEQKVHWAVYQRDKAGSKNWRKVAEKSKAATSFELETGSYVVRAAYGHASAAIAVRVETGKIANTTVIFNAGGLRIKSSLAFIKPPKGQKPSVALTKLGHGDGGLELQAIEPGKIIRLNAGPYRLTSKFGDVNAETSTELIIKPGLLTDVKINHKAALAQFKLVAKQGGKALGKTNWQLRNDKGKILKEVTGIEPMHILAPGDYQLTAERNNKKYSARFTVGIGDTKSIEVLAN